MIVLVEKQKKRRRQVKTVLTRTGVATAPCLGECLGQHPGRFNTGKAHIQPLKQRGPSKHSAPNHKRLVQHSPHPSFVFTRVGLAAFYGDRHYHGGRDIASFDKLNRLEGKGLFGKDAQIANLFAL